ncbi:GIY-YIG nuclease family protein [Natronoglycomyces albus]|uniref:GIY-YIG nuclease family protein n=1 Tax=Natronoglycomyces albus TaxID=2811108 RepID=A0A895XW97_9ACTN|nr:GIY-YIG nuclease family protein [Natronoglycomyces albus]QSB06500.1 GIY-YIG nuclease family protein [Natronoglycomyces albus]
MNVFLPSDIGFVYVISNEAFDEVKIGMTGKLVETRVRALQTGAPTPYEVPFRSLSSRRKEVEQCAHELLSEFRRKEGGGTEWFAVSVETATTAIQQAIAEIEGIAAWAKKSPITLRASESEESNTIFLSLQAGDLLFVVRKSSLFGPSEILDVWFAHAALDQIELRPAYSREDVVGMSDNDEKATHDERPVLDEAGNVHNLAMNGREFLAQGDRLVWISDPLFDSPECVVIDACDYVQVTSRTSKIQVTEDGWPLLMNFFPERKIALSSEARHLLQQAVNNHNPRVLPGDIPIS